MMKNLLIAAVCFGVYSMGTAQDNCSKFYPMQEGTSMQFMIYDNKEKMTGVLDYVVKESGNDKATMANEMHDDKGKLISSSEYDIFCRDDGISIDFNSLLSPGIMEQYKDAEVDITGTELVYPNNLSEGQSLPDAVVLMNIKMPPINMKMSNKVSNRKVVSRESLTTPAGKFDCFVITFDNEMKMGIKISGSSKLWLAEGVGMVRQENYNKKGNMISSMVLTQFSK